MSMPNMQAARDAAFATGIVEERFTAHRAAGFDELAKFVDRRDGIPMFASR
jgi:hypothetical protein